MRYSAIRSARFRRAITRCRAWLWRGCTILLSALALLAGVSWFAIDWTDEGTDDYAGGVVLRDASGGILRVTLGEGDVDCRPRYVADPDDWIVKALVAAEDGTYWTHCGVRPLSMLRAFAQNAFSRRRVSGASTITMQTVRLIRPHGKSYAQKWIEAFRALKMERRKDKVWILSQYLNRAPFGSNLVGIEAAAAGWFGKDAKALGPGEAALLAGMVQAPSRLRPDRGYEAAIRRRDYVLGRMRALGMLTAEQAEGAGSVRPAVCRAPRPFRAPHFCDWAMRSLEGDGRAASRRRVDVVTTLDPDVQAACERAVAETAASGGRSAAAVVLRVDSGAVLALACSGDFSDRAGGQVNTAASARPAGSTLKPLLAALAMDRGIVTPEERLEDAPCAFRGYRPANFDGTYRGPVTLRDALVLSLNVPFVRLLERMGVEPFGDGLRDFGFAHLGGDVRACGLGLAIGNAEVTLVELVGAYAALARGGTYLPPAAVADGSARSGGVRVCSPEAAYLVADMLSGAERSAAALGHVADAELPRFAWKTGTSSAYRDAWTVVWNPEYVIGVWCGHLSGGFGDRTLVGAKAAAPVAWGIARTLYPRGDGPWFAEPDGIVRRPVCALSGLPPGPACAETEQGRAIRGTGAAPPCAAHAASAARIEIARPWDGEVFRMASGTAGAEVVCASTGGGTDGRRWWFVDGEVAGETAPSAPFVAKLRAGGHEIACASADGAAASVRVSVRP